MDLQCVYHMMIYLSIITLYLYMWTEICIDKGNSLIIGRSSNSLYSLLNYRGITNDIAALGKSVGQLQLPIA